MESKNHWHICRFNQIDPMNATGLILSWLFSRSIKLIRFEHWVFYLIRANWSCHICFTWNYILEWPNVTQLILFREQKWKLNQQFLSTKKFCGILFDLCCSFYNLFMLAIFVIRFLDLMKFLIIFPVRLLSFPVFWSRIFHSSIIQSQIWSIC